MPPSAQVGAVAKSDKALLLISAAHHRDKASPVLTPQRFPPIEHSLSSASNSAEHRIEFPKLTQTSMFWPSIKLHAMWSAPPVPSVAGFPSGPGIANRMTFVAPDGVPKKELLAATIRSASARRSRAFWAPCCPSVGSTYTATRPIGLVPTCCEVPV